MKVNSDRKTEREFDKHYFFVYRTWHDWKDFVRGRSGRCSSCLSCLCCCFMRRSCTETCARSCARDSTPYVHLSTCFSNLCPYCYFLRWWSFWAELESETNLQNMCSIFASIIFMSCAQLYLTKLDTTMCRVSVNSYSALDVAFILQAMNVLTARLPRLCFVHMAQVS